MNKRNISLSALILIISIDFTQHYPKNTYLYYNGRRKDDAKLDYSESELAYLYLHNSNNLYYKDIIDGVNKILEIFTDEELSIINDDVNSTPLDVYNEYMLGFEANQVAGNLKEGFLQKSFEIFDKHNLC